MKGVLPAPVPDPKPSPPPPPHPGGKPLPPSVACISVVAANGTSTEFCAARGEAKTSYSATTAGSTSWSTALSKPGGVTVQLAGTISVATSASAAGASELEWTLVKAESPQMVVRAVDLGFGFVGLSSWSDKHFTTHQGKNWCPPRTGCQEWHGGMASCVNGVGQCDTASLAAQLPPPSAPSTGAAAEGDAADGRVPPWAPPQPLPWAYEALLKPGRSAFTGGVTATSSHGFAGWSSQPSLPFQSFGTENAHAAVLCAPFLI